MGEQRGNDMKGTRPDPKVADPNKDVVSTLGQEDGQAGNQQSGGQQSGQQQRSQQQGNQQQGNQQQGNQQSGQQQSLQQDQRQGGNADTQRANR